VLETVASLTPDRIHVVIGHGAEQVRTAFPDHGVNWVEQTERRGTGHAVKQAMPDVGEDATVLVVYGDVPLIGGAILTAAVEAAAPGHLALVTAEVDDPAGLGRILREDGDIRGIVEHRDASQAQRRIREINTGILAAPRRLLMPWLERLSPENAQGEYYLTDAVAMAVADGVPVVGLTVEDPLEVTGINNRRELAALERRYQRRLVDQLMDAGLSVADPDRVDVRGRVTSGLDCFVDVNVVLEGDVTLGTGVHIGPGCVVRDAVLGDGVRLEAHTLVDGARISAGCVIGPFARLRPGTELSENVRIGNFVETKKAVLGPGSKANHLAYLGDATVGRDCNVGAGTVTCNYDGIDKHPTTIGDNVFVGTNSTLVAPLNLARGSFVAAGSTVTQNVPEDELAVGRGRQRNIRGWTRPDQRKRRT
jgi:bifunctional UDP-N-acetylglucosamine pyrophosphorylase/glucosamine-1-phosphate N-acetyltransferase